MSLHFFSNRSSLKGSAIFQHRSWLPSLMLWFGLITIGLPPSLQAASTEILLVNSGNAAIYKQTAKAIRNSCDKDTSCPAITTISLPVTQKALRRHLDSAKVAITIGQNAAQQAIQTNASTPVVHALITSRGQLLLQRIKVRYKGQRTTLLLDQPINKQLSVIKAALPKAKKIGVIFGPASLRLKQSVRKAVAANGFQLVERFSKSRNTLGAKLKSLLGSVDIIFALPDPVLYNRSTLPNVLLTSFRKKVPVIGFSSGFVKAGALFAIHSTPVLAGRQAKQLALDIIKGDFRKTTVSPSHFELSINRGVAKSLGIRLPGKKAILRRWAQ